MRRFKAADDGIVVDLSRDERVFLADILPLLAGVGERGVDPAADRLSVPVYLDDREASEEWWRLMGADLEAAHASDREVFRRLVGEEGPVTIDRESADAVVRVLNQARLVLGARMGIDVESDHDDLPEESRQVMDYIGGIQEELTFELMLGL